MKLLCWNVNGLRSIHSKGFEKVLEEHAPDIASLQETRIQALQFQELVPSPVNRAYHFSEASKKGYSGVGNAYSSLVPVKSETLRRGIGRSEFDSEGRFLISDHGDFELWNVYIPSGSSGEDRQAFKYRFLDSFHDHLAALPKKRRGKIVICGDFNICHKEIDIHHPDKAEKQAMSGFLPDERRWMDRFVDLGFVDSFRLIHGAKPHMYTWWSFRAGSRKKNLGWRLDYFFVGEDLAPKVKDARILSEVLGSDHCPIIVELAL